MYKKVIGLISGKYLKYGLFLWASLLLSAILNGLCVGIIAPLLEFDSASQSNNIFVKTFYSLFQYFDISFSLLNILFLALTIVTLSGIFNIISVVFQKKMQLEQEIEKKGSLYKLLSNVELNKLQSMNYGNIMQVIQQETRMSAMLIEYFVRLVSNITNAAVYSVILCLISTKMTFFVGGIVVLVFFILKGLHTRAKLLGRDIGLINDALQQNINTMLYGYKTIKSYLTYNVIIGRQFDKLHNYKQKSKKLAIIESASSSIFEPLALLIVIGSYSIHHYSVSELFIFIVAIVRLYSAIKVVQASHFKISYHYASLERINKLEDELRNSQYTYLAKEVAPYKFNEDVRAVGISFKYQNDKPVLNKVSLTIPKGSKIALVGKSGGGKSTFVDLLMRFYEPHEGRLEIDGVSFEKLSYEDYVGKIGYVTQDPFMLNASILDNVTLYREISKEEVVSSLKKAHAWEFVGELREGIYSLIGESGTMLSGGQRQRIALARALAGDPDILILDEATSALDNESERIVQETIDQIGNGITVIIIAHRLSTVKNVDTIFVFENGQVIEHGSYAQLEQKESGVFRELLNAGQ